MKEKIIQYLENDLSPQERKAFEQALATDTDLQKAFIFQKAQWERLALLRLNAKAAAILNAYKETETAATEDKVSDEPTSAIIKPMPFAFMTVRRVRFAALAAATLLFLFNYNSLLNWIKPNISTPKSTDIIADKPIEIPVVPQPVVVPATPIPSNPVATVPTIPVPTNPKSPQSPVPKSPPSRKTPELRTGSPKSNGSIFMEEATKDSTAFKQVIDGSTNSLDSMYDFKGANDLIYKHLAKINCNHYTVSFVIKTDGTVEQPILEKGDKNCEADLLNQIKTMPLLKKPIYDGKVVDYRYFFTKNE
jgi:hypothetical protein